MGMAKLANKDVSSHCTKIISSDVQHVKQQYYHRCDKHGVTVEKIAVLNYLNLSVVTDDEAFVYFISSLFYQNLSVLLKL